MSKRIIGAATLVVMLEPSASEAEASASEAEA
ncbi:hypothetical protein ABIA39_004936 [Nocardia sp. GAS34]|jgi:hypothetical protein